MKRKKPELVIKYWLEKSKDDLESAKAMLDARRFNWCAFICQQALEKCLKAGYIKRNNKIPPYIHKLERLCQILNLEPPAKILKNIIRIDKYYLAARYPAYKEGINILEYKIAEQIFKETREIYKWLLKELRLQK